MKKKLTEWRDDLPKSEYKILKNLLAEEDEEETYELSELKQMLKDYWAKKNTQNETSSEWSIWFKDKLKWSKDNWMILILGVFVVTFVVYLIKKMWLFIFRE
jgi:hypothetical protein